MTSGSSGARQRDVIVLQSFPTPRPTTNPYIVLLRDALNATSGVTVTTFSWRTALTGRYDVFHAHWPEILVGGRPSIKKDLRQLLFVLFLLRMRVRRTAIVRTQHNLELPGGISRRERRLLEWFDRVTTLRIALNDDTRVPGGQPVVVILHGHYREWYGRFPAAEAVPGRFGYFGLIRRYKNVEALIAAFRQVDGEQYSLRVEGRPSNDELEHTIRTLAGDDPRIALRFAFLSDEELVDVATTSELVVLPYRHMHNSGGVLAALSVDRPVLVPSNAANTRLANEVGPGWVVQYDGELTADALVGAITRIRDERRAPRPDLSAREWPAAAAAHLAAYRRAVSLTRR